jgi:hypothetical protein
MRWLRESVRQLQSPQLRPLECQPRRRHGSVCGLAAGCVPGVTAAGGFTVLDAAGCARHSGRGGIM